MNVRYASTVTSKSIIKKSKISECGIGDAKDTTVQIAMFL